MSFKKKILTKGALTTLSTLAHTGIWMTLCELTTTIFDKILVLICIVIICSIQIRCIDGLQIRGQESTGDGEQGDGLREP